MPFNVRHVLHKLSFTPSKSVISEPALQPSRTMWRDGDRKPKHWPRIYLFGDSLTEKAFFESDGGFGWKLEVRRAFSSIGLDSPGALVVDRR